MTDTALALAALAAIWATLMGFLGVTVWHGACDESARFRDDQRVRLDECIEKYDFHGDGTGKPENYSTDPRVHGGQLGGAWKR